jgi:hypothetical protein
MPWYTLLVRKKCNILKKSIVPQKECLVCVKFQSLQTLCPRLQYPLRTPLAGHTYIDFVTDAKSYGPSSEEPSSGHTARSGHCSYGIASFSEKRQDIQYDYRAPTPDPDTGKQQPTARQLPNT